MGQTNYSLEDLDRNKMEIDTDIDDDNIEIEIIDDTPEEDRVAPRDANAIGDEDFDEDVSEALDYSDKAKKRINRIRYEYHEERRAREAAERERDAAINFAKQNHEYAEKIRKNLVTGEKVLLNEIKSKNAQTIENAKAKYKIAFDEGDSDAIIAAQEELSRAIWEKQQADAYQPPADVPLKEFQQPVQRHKPTEDWKAKNSWFGTDQEKTKYASSYATLLEQRGITATSDPNKYFTMIDNEMKNQFSNHAIIQQKPVSNNTHQSVVAPAKREGGISKLRVQLSDSEKRTARRLNITPEQYAKQKLRIEQAKNS